ncbi:MAG: hypothetical protein AB7Y46_13255 [Armatimonadota bacterium]
MMKRTVQIGLLVAVAAVLVAGLATPTSAERDDGRRYRAPRESYAPSPPAPPYQYPHQQWVPPGHRTVGQGWIPPGHLRNGKAWVWCPYCERDRSYRYPQRRWDDRRYDRRDDWRYDRRGEDDWGIVIRKGRGGTTIGGYYHDRRW